MKPNPSKKCRKNAVIVYSSLLQILKWKNILVQIIRIMTQYIRFSLLALVVPPFHPLGIFFDIILEEMNIDSHGGPRESEISNSWVKFTRTYHRQSRSNSPWMDKFLKRIWTANFHKFNRLYTMIRNRSLLSLGHSVPTICNRSLLSLGHSILRSAISLYILYFFFIFYFFRTMGVFHYARLG